MYNKKDNYKFTIQFSRADPSHLKVADILNRQKRYSKAQYIVDAVLHYISCGLTESAANPVQIDEKYIESIVNRILLDRYGENVDSLSAPASLVEIPMPSQPQNIHKIEFGEGIEAISEEGVKAVTDALVSFRKK